MSHGEFDPGQLTISKSMALGLDVSSPRGDNGYESDDSECVENANSRAVDRAIGVESDGGSYRPVAIIRKLGSKVGGLGLLLKSKKERAPRRTVVQALFGGKTAFSGTKDTIVRGVLSKTSDQFKGGLGWWSRLKNWANNVRFVVGVNQNMHKFSLSFLDSKLESEFVEYYDAVRIQHFKKALKILVFYLVFFLLLYSSGLGRDLALESALPDFAYYFDPSWIVLAVIVVAGLLKLSEGKGKLENVFLLLVYTLFFMLVVVSFVLMHYSIAPIYDCFERFQGAKDYSQIQKLLQAKKERLSASEIVEGFMNASATHSFEEMKQVAEISVFWLVTMSCGVFAVVLFSLLDSLLIMRFRAAFYLMCTIVVLLWFVFGATSTGSIVYMFTIIASTILLKIRHGEKNDRNEFVMALAHKKKWQEEIAKVERKSEELKKKLMLSEEQLKICDTVENKIVGNKRAELRPWQIDCERDVQFDKKIGNGAFGIVYVAKFVRTGRSVAVKQLLSDRVNEETMERFFGEILLHSRLHHPHVVVMLGASWEAPNFCLVLEYCEQGDLETMLKSGDSSVLTWFTHKLRIANEIAQGVGYLHSQNVIHRDLKTANVLVDSNTRMKVSDFGESKILAGDNVNMTTVGTNFYIAPEVFRGDSAYDTKADVYGFGIIMIALCVKEGSLRDFFVDQLGRRVKVNANYVSIEQSKGWKPKLLNFEGPLSGKFDLSPNPEFAEAVSQLILSMIDLDPDKRPKMSSIVSALHNLDRWIAVSPPMWLVSLNPDLTVGGTVNHSKRGVGVILNFDGLGRVHILFFGSGEFLNDEANRYIYDEGSFKDKFTADDESVEERNGWTDVKTNIHSIEGKVLSPNALLSRLKINLGGSNKHVRGRLSVSYSEPKVFPQADKPDLVAQRSLTLVKRYPHMVNNMKKNHEVKGSTNAKEISNPKRTFMRKLTMSSKNLLKGGGRGGLDTANTESKGGESGGGTPNTTNTTITAPIIAKTATKGGVFTVIENESCRESESSQPNSSDLSEFKEIEEKIKGAGDDILLLDLKTRKRMSTIKLSQENQRSSFQQSKMYELNKRKHLEQFAKQGKISPSFCVNIALESGGEGAATFEDHMIHKLSILREVKKQPTKKERSSSARVKEIEGEWGEEEEEL